MFGAPSVFVILEFLHVVPGAAGIDADRVPREVAHVRDRQRFRVAAELEVQRFHVTCRQITILHDIITGFK